MKREWLLLQDNDPKHTSGSIVEDITRRNQNFTEYLLIKLKRAVQTRQAKNLIALEAFARRKEQKNPKTRTKLLGATHSVLKP